MNVQVGGSLVGGCLVGGCRVGERRGTVCVTLSFFPRLRSMWGAGAKSLLPGFFSRLDCRPLLFTQLIRFT